MSTRDSTIGERLRRVRGEESQEAFSRRVGITRSALANYETGRTQPKPSVLRQISQRLGIPESALLSGDAGSFRELASLLGSNEDIAGLPGLTEHERAIIRVLRLCPPETVHSVVRDIISTLESKDFFRELADPLTIVDDIGHLYMIEKAKGAYDRGVTPDTLAAILDRLKSGQGDPQSAAVLTKSNA
ncbi:helix-turn-helix domain-containing protein [uncultured Amaricoccus sp.]|uniref:helix-turn-helix domain-containing protein n=1 Tax=uncultured Amaricoccus sp. TaxID=339341 RepID=UPI00345DC014